MSFVVPRCQVRNPQAVGIPCQVPPWVSRKGGAGGAVCSEPPGVRTPELYQQPWAEGGLCAGDLQPWQHFTPLPTGTQIHQGDPPWVPPLSCVLGGDAGLPSLVGEEEGCPG